jgi:hypothetical protein
MAEQQPSIPGFMDLFEPALIETFVLARALRGPVFTEELGRMLAAIDVDWDAGLVRGRMEHLERTRRIERRGTGYELTDEGRQDAERALRLWGRALDEAGVRPTAPPNPRMLQESDLRSGPGARPEGATARDRAGERGRDRAFDDRHR